MRQAVFVIGIAAIAYALCEVATTAFPAQPVVEVSLAPRGTAPAEATLDDKYPEPLLYIFTDGSHWSTLSDRPAPKGKTLRRTLRFVPWDCQQSVYFHPDGKTPLSVLVDMAGCGNEESTIFLYKVCSATVTRHPDNIDLTTSRNGCLERWIEDETKDAVGVDDGKGLSPQEIIRRVKVHFNGVWDENELWTSARAMVWTTQDVDHFFIN